MDESTLHRLFDYHDAFDHPVTRWITIAAVVLLLVAPVTYFALGSFVDLDEKTRRELGARYRSWCIIAPLMMVPILLGAAWTIVAIAALALLCYREYARATGLFRDRAVHFATIIGIFVCFFAVIDHWFNFFTALMPLGIGVIAAMGLAGDRPDGYIQRVALGVFGFMLFAPCLGSLAYIANDARYRPIILTILLCVEMNDIFAFMVGRALGRKRIAPKTSPRKTRAGSVGALILTTALFVVVGHALFAGTVLDSFPHLVALGVLISAVGQIGDLVLSSIKRDLGIKDMASTIPGHGGLLDRFDSLIFVAPVFFHYVGYFLGFGWDQSTRILTRFLI